MVQSYNNVSGGLGKCGGSVSNGAPKSSFAHISLVLSPTKGALELCRQRGLFRGERLVTNWRDGFGLGGTHLDIWTRDMANIQISLF